MSFTEGSIMKLKFVFRGCSLHMDFIDFVLKEFEVRPFKEGTDFPLLGVYNKGCN